MREKHRLQANCRIFNICCYSRVLWHFSRIQIFRLATHLRSLVFRRMPDTPPVHGFQDGDHRRRFRGRREHGSLAPPTWSHADERHYWSGSRCVIKSDRQYAPP